MLSIRRLTGIVLVAGCMASPAIYAQGAYTSNPLAEWLMQESFELRIETQADIASNKHHRFGILAGFGWGFTESISLGFYGSLRGSDRDLPARWKVLRGLGMYGEYRFDPIFDIVPIAGLRAGILSPTGPSAPTSLHLAGNAGLRIPLTAHVHLALTGSLNWTQDKLLNYRRTRNHYKADNTDISIDLGLRYLF